MSEQSDRDDGTDAAFDDEDAAAVEALYTTDTAERRRRFVRDHLGPEPGEAVLSVGPGPGFEPAELAEAVGPAGRVHAVDESEPMLDLARRRCGDREQVTLERGDATDLPVDAAASVQVTDLTSRQRLRSPGASENR